MSMFDRLSPPEPQKAIATTKKRAATTVAVATDKQPIPSAPKKGRGGKSSNPDYGTLLSYIPLDVKKNALRKWEDANPEAPDASDMVEYLLRDYLKR